VEQPWRLSLKRVSVLLTPLLLLALSVPAAALPLDPPPATLPFTATRDAAPVVLTGKQLPQLSAPAPIPVRPLYTDETNTTEVVPPDSSHGANVPVDSIAVFMYSQGAFAEIPSQVDERFWRYLNNFGGENGPYSGYDPELTYVFDEEGVRKTAGECYAQYPEGQPITTPDNVPGLDDDDEVAFMARDAGVRAPAGASPVTGQKTYEVEVKDPVTEAVSYVYVLSAPGREHMFEHGYVSYERDRWSDRYIGARSGEGIPDGVRCVGPDGPSYEGDPNFPSAAPEAGASVGARRPRDTATFMSSTYSFHWGGRWIPDEIHLANTDSDGGYGPDLIDQWKGRAFQQTRKQAVSVGFIGDKAWEESSVTLGERVGPIRALRETQGAKSGTNVTRLYTLYDKVFIDTFYLRVHPIPPDGIYSMYDHNQGAVSTYYSPAVPGGVPIDGVNDEKFGNLDIGTGTPAESHYDIADPTVQPFSPVEMWEEVAGPNGSIVYYVKENRPGPGVLTSYYRDDANFDDGSGSDPVDHQGSFGTHGIHFYATGDTDNLPFGFPFSEMGVSQSQYMLPGNAGNVGEAYAAAERFPLKITTTLVP
jgi:hypothetical protein